MGWDGCDGCVLLGVGCGCSTERRCEARRGEGWLRPAGCRLWVQHRAAMRGEGRDGCVLLGVGCGCSTERRGEARGGMAASCWVWAVGAAQSGEARRGEGRDGFVLLGVGCGCSTERRGEARRGEGWLRPAGCGLWVQHRAACEASSAPCHRAAAFIRTGRAAPRTRHAFQGARGELGGAARIFKKAPFLRGTSERAPLGRSSSGRA